MVLILKPLFPDEETRSLNDLLIFHYPFWILTSDSLSQGKEVPDKH
jgi:hypothetical protein